MTAVPAPAADSPGWRVGRIGAYGGVAGCAVLFTGGLLAWASDPLAQRAAVLWSLSNSWSGEQLDQAVLASGLSFATVAGYLMLLDLLWAAAGVTAALLVLRGATSWFRLYLGTVLAVWATTGGALAAVFDATGQLAVARGVEVLLGLGWCAAFALPFLFPDGRIVPAWGRWCLIGLALYLPVQVVLEAAGVVTGPDSPVAVLPLLVLFAAGAYAAVHRYRTSPGALERLQVRGVMAALVLWLAVVLLRVPLVGLLEQPTGAGLVAGAGYVLLSYSAVVLLCAAVVVAVLRHQLYAVDLWVNRGLVYGGLTALVALLYAVLVALGGLIWQGRGLAVPVVVTCVLAVLLHPLRVGLQRLVDRFVYGRAMDPRSLLRDVRASRERILVAREYERARLQRDLHDGLGPTLASLYQRVDAARVLIHDDPAAAAELLTAVGDQTREVIGDIRSLVRSLRPPELDQLGLVGAIEATGARLDGLPLTVTAGDLEGLNPAVEVAAYRIVTEALTNTSRHARSGAASVRLQRSGGSLLLAVTDDGVGIADDPEVGTGLRSMRERAEELGGTFEAERAPGGGTRIRVVLPWLGAEIQEVGSDG